MCGDLILTGINPFICENSHILVSWESEPQRANDHENAVWLDFDYLGAFKTQHF